MFIESTDPEWAHMWSLLAASEGDTECLNMGEAWQYMGTAPADDPEVAPAEAVHCFRHRNHPKTGRRMYMSVAPSSGWLTRNAAAVAKMLANKAGEKEIPF